MNNAVKSAASKFGPIIAAIGISYTLIAYLVDMHLMVNMWAGISLWVINFVLLIIAVRTAKVAMGGFISFKNAFSTFLLTFVLSSLLSTVFAILLFGVVDTEAADQLQELTIETSVSFMEKLGTPESEIEKQVSAMEENNQFSALNQVKGFFMGIVFYAILGLIVAAVMKKDKPNFEYQPLDGDNE
ncbi:hypothetical protein Oweho_0855 [Owenweeksia hongkongensis DSM 17368]|uniref:DUF4199 domain-containing protein n=1 Tax=Owenweeksia hongkongensis (strain DSM 17368 / CIP 108786 / JCM 12287 / NRRL B-23963 / UST20020801) TaxID=926562 RepID=G8R2R2_OWEHD|nr:DUF4199 domain-containing protein [Owenweeksia hongkongensis]AEV31867.1 hypothetical protein Oweho_0855 [Owenweeksia hongkongensis DSM 17368]